MRPNPIPLLVALLLPSLAACGGGSGGDADVVTLLNVSYDPTRELYAEYNDWFERTWRERTGQTVEVRQSHGGSGKQARAVLDGLEADVVTLALGFDVDALRRQGNLIADGWQQELPHASAPYTSTIVFLVRAGNPKGIEDWGDLVQEGVQVITPNPKTSGGARWNYLAAWGYALARELGGRAVLTNPSAHPEYERGREAAQAFVAELFKRVPVLDSGARGATNTFVKNGIGDVLLAWENEAHLAVRELGADGLEIVVPSLSILAEPSVAVVDAIVDRRGTRALAQAYLEGLYTPEAQRIAAKHFYRPRDPDAAGDRFAKIELFTVEEAFGGWDAAHAEHFADGGVFDRIMGATR